MVEKSFRRNQGEYEESVSTSHFCVLHQARQDLPVPDMQAGIFIAQA